MDPQCRIAAEPTGARPPAIGLLMLETRFPRPFGDIGNRNSFGFPVIAQTVRGASAERVVRGRAEGLLAPFVDAGLGLVERGAVAIATSCGFLALHQRALAESLPVPVATSSLLQVPWVERMLAPGRRCGVICFDADALDAAHFEAVGAAPDTPFVGMPRTGELHRAILSDAGELDLEAVRAEVQAAARALLRSEPRVAAIVLECTNLPPYAQTLRATLRMPVYDSTSLLEWLWLGFSRGVHR